MKLDNYYLDLKKVSDIESKHERDQIHNYYRDMLHFFQDGRIDSAKSIMLTLELSGYLINSRDKKLEDILDDK